MGSDLDDNSSVGSAAISPSIAEARDGERTTTTSGDVGRATGRSIVVSAFVSPTSSSSWVFTHKVSWSPDDSACLSSLVVNADCPCNDFTWSRMK